MPKFLVRITFLAGFFLGILLGLILLPKPKRPTKSFLPPKLESKYEIDTYGTWFVRQKLRRVVIPMDTFRYGSSSYFAESKYLFDKIRITCLILVHKIKYANASLMTWAKHCNNVELLQLKQNKLGSKHNKNDASWPLLCNALVNTSGSFHWVLVVKETTFAVVENVRYLVAPLNHSGHYYLGHAIKFWGTKYNVGQAGYILSNGTLAALKTKMETDSCPTNSVVWNLEDFYLGRTLSQLNINVSDTRDKLGFAVFHGFNLQKLFFPGSTTLSNYYKHSIYPTFCCSPKSITFQVSNEHRMYTYEYLLNQLQIFTSGSLGNRKPPTPISQEEVWKSVLKEHGHVNFNMSSEEYYEFWVDLVSDPVAFAQKIKGSS